MPAAAQPSAFRALHDAGTFIIPNPWDAGSARMLQSMGFKALATTSAGMAFSLGIKEGTATIDQVLDHCRVIVGATSLPVSADLENGYADTADAVAKTIRLAGACGLAGGSIEDFSGDPDRPIYDFAEAVERVQAAVEAAGSLDSDFVFTARAENFLHGRPDLDDTIRRLKAFEAAGADVLYAPGLRDIEAIREVCAALEKPFNAIMGLPGAAYSIDELKDAGVRRISVGSALARLAYGHAIRAGLEMSEQGTFTFGSDAMGFAEIESHL